MKNHKESKNHNIMKNNHIEEPDMIIQYNTLSAYDCTGLIPAKVESDAEIHHYQEMYSFLPPVVDVKKSEKE